MTTEKDIVSRLRECNEGLLQECQTPELGDIVTDFSSIAEAANEIEELRKERDDARLEIWENHPRTTLGAREYADARGWAPFMEENDNA